MGQGINIIVFAEAITTGNPLGGNEIIYKTYKYDWLAESVTEEEIIESQRRLAESGYFVEPASATSLFAIKKLRKQGKIARTASVVMILTGSGLKDSEVLQYHKFNESFVELKDVEEYLREMELIKSTQEEGDSNTNALSCWPEA